VADAALVAAAFSVTYLGWALLALRQRPHFRAVSARDAREGAPPALRRKFLGWGSASLCAGSCASWLAEGSSFGSLLWIFVLACSGVAVTFTLSWRPGWLRCLIR